ncbi:MAG TPA: hypothetical protein ENK02_12625 [Planctomycetes bacterium]|nr:hypothetical protein [Planctomycetota bacterium]
MLAGSFALVATLSIPWFTEKEPMAQGGTALSAKVLEWGMLKNLPGEFLGSPESIGNGLLRLKLRLKGLSQGVHPGYFLVDRINGGPSRVSRFQRGPSTREELGMGELWDYQVLGQPDPLEFPKRGACFVELRFVVPTDFHWGVLDFRGRSLARIGR